MRTPVEILAMDISAHEKLVALAMAVHPEREGHKLGVLASETSLPERKVASVLRQLEQRGLVTIRPSMYLHGAVVIPIPFRSPQA